MVIKKVENGLVDGRRWSNECRSWLIKKVEGKKEEYGHEDGHDLT